MEKVKDAIMQASEQPEQQEEKVQQKFIKVNERIENSLENLEGKNSSLRQDVLDFTVNALKNQETDATSEHNVSNYEKARNDQEKLSAEEFDLWFNQSYSPALNLLVSLGSLRELRATENQKKQDRQLSSLGLNKENFGSAEEAIKYGEEYVMKKMGYTKEEFLGKREALMKAKMTSPKEFLMGVILCLGEDALPIIESIEYFGWDALNSLVAISKYLSYLFNHYQGKITGNEVQAKSAQELAKNVVDSNSFVGFVSLGIDSILLPLGMSVDGDRNRADLAMRAAKELGWKFWEWDASQIAKLIEIAGLVVGARYIKGKLKGKGAEKVPPKVVRELKQKYERILEKVRKNKENRPFDVILGDEYLPKMLTNGTKVKLPGGKVKTVRYVEKVEIKNNLKQVGSSPERQYGINAYGETEVYVSWKRSYEELPIDWGKNYWHKYKVHFEDSTSQLLSEYPVNTLVNNGWQIMNPLYEEYLGLTRMDFLANPQTINQNAVQRLENLLYSLEI